MEPGDIVVCVNPGYWGNRGLLNRGQAVMILDVASGDKRINFGDPSILVRMNNGDELWMWTSRFAPYKETKS